MAVEVQTGPVFRAGHPQVLFKLSLGGGFAPAPDGKRFLVERKAESSDKTTLVTITNWFDDLLRREPLKR
jgi:hypothetical protein